LSVPAPIIFRGLSAGIVTAEAPHDDVPAETFIVSPADALETQLATEAESEELVHVGLDPVQAAKVFSASPKIPQIIIIIKKSFSYKLFFCIL